LRFLPSVVKVVSIAKLAAYGHVGRMDIGLPLEVTDKAAVLREAGAAPRKTRQVAAGLF